MVAQPPFSINELWSHDVETFLNSTSFVAASACASNFATQTGVSAATTATSARSFAILSAVLPSVHPSAEKPTTAIPTAPTTAPHTAGLNPGWLFIFFHRDVRRRDFSCLARRKIRYCVANSPRVDSETT